MGGPYTLPKTDVVVPVCTPVPLANETNLLLAFYCVLLVLVLSWWLWLSFVESKATALLSMLPLSMVLMPKGLMLSLLP